MNHLKTTYRRGSVKSSAGVLGFALITGVFSQSFAGAYPSCLTASRTAACRAARSRRRSRVLSVNAKLSSSPVSSPNGVQFGSLICTIFGFGILRLTVRFGVRCFLLLMFWNGNVENDRSNLSRALFATVKQRIQTGLFRDRKLRGPLRRLVIATRGRWSVQYLNGQQIPIHTHSSSCC